jgi:hypothetical protein
MSGVFTPINMDDSNLPGETAGKILDADNNNRGWGTTNQVRKAESLNFRKSAAPQGNCCTEKHSKTFPVPG